MMNDKILNVRQYDEAVSYVLEIPRFLAKNEPEKTREFLEHMGGNSTDAKTFHVAGTNGKGSVCAFIDSTCRQMGYKTGKFTSPHLVNIRERIMLDGEMVSEEEFLQGFMNVRDYLESFEEDFHPSFFEFIFFIAVDIFNRAQIEVAIYETGLGGRLDATNSMIHADMTIITSIGMDHMEYLGDTIEKIAGEKAGIIKESVPVVYWAEDKEASAVIEEQAKLKKSEAIPVGAQESSLLFLKEYNIDFCYKSRYYSSVNLSCHTRAKYQIDNASLALRAMEYVFDKDELTVENMQAGIANMRHPGRMEGVGNGVYLDGCHNVDGVEAFINTVKSTDCKGKRYLIYSGVADKEIVKIGKLLEGSSLFDEISVCAIHNGRAVDTEHLKTCFEAPVVYEDVISAYEALMKKKQTEDEIYVCGSLYLIGEMKAYLESTRG